MFGGAAPRLRIDSHGRRGASPAGCRLGLARRRGAGTDGAASGVARGRTRRERLAARPARVSSGVGGAERVGGRMLQHENCSARVAERPW